MLSRVAALLLSFSLAVQCAGISGGRVSYLGGTRPDVVPNADGIIDASDETYLAFYARKTGVRIPYDKVNLLEYGQKVNHRYLLALTISPIFLAAKKRQHFLTIGYQDEDGKQQAMLFRVEKNDIRGVLVMLEARTGLKVDYQDDEARRAPKG